MNNLDIIIIFIVAVSALISINRGFIREVLSIVGWVIGAILVVSFLPIAMPFLREHFSSEGSAKIVGSIAIFGAFMIFWMIFSAGIASKIKASKLGNIDKGLGLFFGLFRAFLLIVLLFIMVGFVFPEDDNKPDIFKDSKYFEIAGSFAEPIEKLIPKATLEELEQAAKQTPSKEDKKIEVIQEPEKEAKPAPKKREKAALRVLKEHVDEAKGNKPQNIEDLIGELGLE